MSTMNPNSDHQLAREILNALTTKVTNELEARMLEELEPIIVAAKARVREVAAAAAREMEPSIQSILDRDNSSGGYGNLFKVLIQIKAPGEKWDPDEEKARARS